MISSNLHDQITIEVAQGEYLAINIESFLIDRQTSGLAKKSLKFYRHHLNQFITYCNANSLTYIQQISSDYLRRYLLAYSETHNPGGVHGSFRTLRAFFHWLANEEVMPVEWRNPMLKVRPPKLTLDPLEPISIEDIKTLAATCQNGKFTGNRDYAIFLFLLDTGARAQKLCGKSNNLNVHHKTYKNHGLEHANLKDSMVLCKICHPKFHDKFDNLDK